MGPDPDWELAWERLGGHQGLGAVWHREHLPASMLQVADATCGERGSGGLSAWNEVISVEQVRLGYLVALEVDQ